MQPFGTQVARQTSVHDLGTARPGTASPIPTLGAQMNEQFLNRDAPEKIRVETKTGPDNSFAQIPPFVTELQLHRATAEDRPVRKQPAAAPSDGPGEPRSLAGPERSEAALVNVRHRPTAPPGRKPESASHPAEANN